MFEQLTVYLDKLGEGADYGETIIDRENDGSSEHPIAMPYVKYSEDVRRLMREIYRFADEHPEYDLREYNWILNKSGVMKYRREDIPLEKFSEQVVLAMLYCSVRAEHFGDGAFLYDLEQGHIQRLLARLREIDQARMS